jgi:hypothetical protein
MKYTDEFLKKIMQCGTLGYLLSKILNVLDIENEAEFKVDFNNKESEVSKNYQKGIDRADFVLDSKLFEMAKDGDLKALDKYERRKDIQIRKKENEDRDAQYRSFK